jgi:hypothetical protein
VNTPEWDVCTIILPKPMTISISLIDYPPSVSRQYISKVFEYIDCAIVHQSGLQYLFRQGVIPQSHFERSFQVYLMRSLGISVREFNVLKGIREKPYSQNDSSSVILKSKMNSDDHENSEDPVAHVKYIRSFVLGLSVFRTQMIKMKEESPTITTNIDPLEMFCSLLNSYGLNIRQYQGLSILICHNVD